ncbi:MAG: hypothetical protein AAF401_09040 [Pseudomonadota bacterium]
MIFAFFGALVLGAATGAASERFGFTRNGYIISMALGIGGAMLLWFAQALLGLSLGLSRPLTSIVGAAALLFLNNVRR